MIGRRQFGMGLGAAAFAAPAIVQAQKFPSGRVTMVVPFPAGAATDISARVYAERLSALWGQPVVIDNKGGGNGIPAAESVARAKPDGLTLFATSAMTQVVNPAIYDKLPYDPIADFTPISRMGTSPFVLLVDRNSPINSAAELTAKLKAEPGKHNYGAGALPARVASELYKMAAGVDAVNAKIAMDRGALKGLFVTESERYAAVPAMPTAAEAGLPEVLLTTWTGFYAPKGTPAEIVNRINADLYTVSAMPEVVERLAALGGTPKLMRPAEFAAFASAEKERWGQIIRRANIKVE